jgi:hypothetical protein
MLCVCVCVCLIITDFCLSHPFHSQIVGKWFNSLELDLPSVTWNRGTTDLPTSACSLPCEKGMIKKQQVSQSLLVEFV